MHRLNVPAALLAAILFAVELGIFMFATGEIRSRVGDLLVVVLADAALASVNLGRARQRLAAVGAIALVTELVQGLHLVAPDAHWLLHLSVGSTFDPVDLVAYACGLAIAWGCERGWREPPA